MSAGLGETERELQTAARSYLDAKIAPVVSIWEQRREFPWDVLPGLYDLGYVRGVVPAAHGGYGTTFLQQAVLMEEAGRRLSLRFARWPPRPSVLNQR